MLNEYQLWIEHMPPDDLDSDRHSCGLTQENVTVTIPSVSSSCPFNFLHDYIIGEQ